jgi:hypothetical protein
MVYGETAYVRLRGAVGVTCRPAIGGRPPGQGWSPAPAPPPPQPCMLAPPLPGWRTCPGERRRSQAGPLPITEAPMSARPPRRGRVPVGCGYCFGTSPHPSERGQSASDHHAKKLSTQKGIPLPSHHTPSRCCGERAVKSLTPFRALSAPAPAATRGRTRRGGSHTRRDRRAAQSCPDRASSLGPR